MQAQNVVGPFGFRAFTHLVQQKSNNTLQTFEEESHSAQLTKNIHYNGLLPLINAFAKLLRSPVLPVNQSLCEYWDIYELVDL